MASNLLVIFHPYSHTDKSNGNAFPITDNMKRSRTEKEWTLGDRERKKATKKRRDELLATQYRKAVRKKKYCLARDTLEPPEIVGPIGAVGGVMRSSGVAGRIFWVGARMAMVLVVARRAAMRDMGGFYRG